MNWFRRNPVRATLAPALFVTLIVTAALWWGLSREWVIAPWLLCWIGAVNGTAFLMYGLDKSLARQGAWRVPEASLLALAFVGGTVGAYAGMRYFRHKTIKSSFRIVFWLLVAVHLVLIGVLIRYVWLR